MKFSQLYQVLLLCSTVHTAISMKNDCTEGEYMLTDENMAVKQCINNMLVSVACKSIANGAVSTTAIQTTNDDIITITNHCITPTKTVTLSNSCGQKCTNEIQLTNSPTNTPCPSPSTQISIEESAPFIAAIGFLLCVVVTLSIGWVCTCVVMKSKIDKNGKSDNSIHDNPINGQTNPIHLDYTKPHPQTNVTTTRGYEIGSTNEGAGHTYDTINSVRGSQPENLSSQQTRRANGSKIQYNTPDPNDDYHDYHELEQEQTNGDDEQSEGNDYDSLEELNTDNMVDQNYHVLESPGAGQQRDHNVLESPGAGQQRDHYVEGARVLRHEQDNIYDVLAKSEETLNPSDNDYHELENDSIVELQAHQTVQTRTKKHSLTEIPTNMAAVAMSVNFDPQDYEIPSPSPKLRFKGQDDDDYSRLKH